MRGRVAVVVIALVVSASTAQGQETVSDAVVRLAPDAFPALPGPIRSALTKRGCRIPQSYGERNPHNVIAGAFTGPKRREWAAVCSVRDTSTILIFSAAGQLVDSTERREDEFWMEHMPEGRVYAQRLRRVTPAELRKLPPDPDEPDLGVPRPVDHDAITQVIDGKGSTTLYKHAGRWRQVHACC